ncbi:hypothetical protein [Lunatibacter salilacus]|uniref:hypothetical protein n=1 Tax=Lunatibacter salilacus TaxID=2483804 RepID=UPI00131C9E25|nr:hypothetical protein [Lunatibacter salilacus]
MAKVKISKKDLPILRRDLELDEEVLKNLQELQETYKSKFEGNIQEAQKEALASYESKIKALKEAKARVSKEYEAEIKKYTALVKDLKSQSTETHAG